MACGLGITWPRPSEAELAQYYDRGYYDERGMGEGAADDWMERAAALVSLIPGRPRRLLDVGAGEGHFVASLRRLGFDAEGVEPLPLGREAAQRIHSLTLRPELPEAGGYDAVTLIHSLEHVADPLATLAACERRLARDGWLLIELPHAASVEMLRPVLRSHILNLPGHLHHFTPASLTALLAKAGFTTAEVRLRNPDFLEWLLALRARLKRAPRSGSVGAGGAVASRTSPAADSPRRSGGLWRDRLLPALRARFPGWSFALIARRAAESGLPG